VPAAEAVVPVVSEPQRESAPAFELNFESAQLAAPVGDRKSSPDRASRPRLAVVRRRSASEDLISELFEIMHDLHFMRDVAAGSEFVLSVLDEVLPCEGALVHVFDINTSQFVIVRAKGPHAGGVLLQRMPDKDPMVKSVMRAHRTTSVKDVSNTPRFLGPRWPALGIQPRVALCGPVQQGGRYLGLIELVNPLGDGPFHSNEINALDYICEQFAEFLSKKPIVLTADVVLAKS
jgi:GAF domain-containing protein